MNSDEEYTPMKEPKFCFVPVCKNNSRDTSKKTFFAIPRAAKQEWCVAVNASCPKRLLYICEDHLNLEEDMENYRYWITMKRRPRLKTHLPQSLVRKSHLNYKDSKENNKPRSSIFSTSLVQIKLETTNNNYIITKRNKGTQVKPKTSDSITYVNLTHICS